MNNCLLCSNCSTEGGYEEGYFGYTCTERELENDKRFPYKNTKCNKFKKDDSICSLSAKDVSKELWNTITWEVY
ncbi:MAG: hypothetical protein ACRC1T_05620 [Clostridium chrysemydis]|uniref:hypothetical protein n=1 Tax=Clostridium chrysemydis TaxID=2665504 RepID=UPI003F31B0A1